MILKATGRLSYVSPVVLALSGLDVTHRRGSFSSVCAPSMRYQEKSWGGAAQLFVSWIFDGVEA